MSWKRSKDGGLDYDTSTNFAYEEVKRLAFGEDKPLRNPRLQEIRERRLTSNDDIDVKLNLKERLKQRIKKGSLR